MEEETGNEPIVKTRKIQKTDWLQIESFVKNEHKRRKDMPSRKMHEKIWTEVDRQIAMQPMVRVDQSGNKTDPTWHHTIEVGELTRSLEVLKADVRRIAFPSNRSWFESHAEIEFPLDEETGRKSVDQEQQKFVDGALRSMMVQQHQDFGFKARFDLCINEALGHGSFVAEVIWDSAAKVYDGSGMEFFSAPTLQPHSMWNCFPDPSPSIIGTDMFYRGSMVIVSYKPIYILKDEASGKEGWMNLGKIQKRQNKNKDGDTEDVEIVTYYGDCEIKRQDGNIYLPNSKVVLANDTIVYYGPIDTPYPPVLFTGYERLDIRDPYYVSPITKLSPMQKFTSICINQFMNAVALQVEPPIQYNGNDQNLVAMGGPKIAPGMLYPTKTGTTWDVLQTGDPRWALEAAQMGMMQVQMGTGVDAQRAGSADATNDKTATEIRRTSQAGQIRTVDFVDKLEGQALRPFLYMQHDLNLKNLQKYSFYNSEMDSPDFVRVTNEDIPKHVHFEIVGSKGVLGEEERSAKMTQVTAFASQNPLFAPLLNDPAILKEAYQDAGAKNPDRFLKLEGQEDQQVMQLKQEIEQLHQEAQEAVQTLQQQLQEAKSQFEIKAAESQKKMELEEFKAMRAMELEEMKAQRAAELEEFKAESKANLDAMMANMKNHVSMCMESGNADNSYKIELAKAAASIMQAEGKKESDEKEENDKTMKLDNLMSMLDMAVKRMTAPRETKLITDKQGNPVAARTVTAEVSQ